MSHREVVLAGHLDYFFDPLVKALSAKGHKSVHYRTPAEFLANKDALASAAVLYAHGFIPVSREALGRAPHLTAVISTWMGTEGFDETAATELGIVVGNGANPENAESMAEATVLMLLSCQYDVTATQQRFRDHIWGQPHLTARMLKGKTVGLFGYGAIARGVVQRLQGWGVSFLATTRHPPADTANVKFVPIDEMIAASDIVCVLAPLTQETRGLFNAKRLAAMKRGSILICTSRGGIVDEAALYELAKQGHFASVGLDVFQTEPLQKDSPLRGLPNAFLTPHGIGHTQEARKRLIDVGVENVLRVLEGEPPLYIRNPDVLPSWRGNRARK
jgi:phosphoglycerate dehydrogenase-like enzyme